MHETEHVSHLASRYQKYNQAECNLLKLNSAIYEMNTVGKNIFVLIRAVPFKSTWEGGRTPFFFLLVVGVKPYFFMLGGFFFYWWGVWIKWRSPLPGIFKWNCPYMTCSLIFFIEHLWFKYSKTCIKRPPLGQKRESCKTGNLLKEVQFIWNVPWHDKKRVTFLYRWLLGQVLLNIHKTKGHCIKYEFSGIEDKNSMCM